MSFAKSHNTLTSACKRVLAGLALAGVLGLTTTASADSPAPIGTYKDWNAFSMAEGGGKVCYVVSQPSEMSPKNVNRGDVFFIVTDWGDGNQEPSVLTGYTFKANTKTTIQIGSDKFSLFTEGDGAWFRSKDEEKKLINAMKRGNTMIVTGTSSRGTLTTDRYSLSGVTAALDKISRTCK